ncbi:MAG: hypothetical protein ACP5NX_03300 [Candidatus Bilamarchaeaceae archaeon]
MADETQLRDRISKESWDSLANMALTLRVEFEGEDKEARKLQKEIAVVKQVLYEHMNAVGKGEAEMNPASMYVRLYKLMETMERKMEKQSPGRHELLYFIDALLMKLKNEKLAVFKPMKMRSEFGKLKVLTEGDK